MTISESLIRIYANLVIEGIKTIDEIPQKFKLAVETLIKEKGI